jgi:hypothetical protein
MAAEIPGNIKQLVIQLTTCYFRVKIGVKATFFECENIAKYNLFNWGPFKHE